MYNFVSNLFDIYELNSNHNVAFLKTRFLYSYIN